jgi:hypothetical protein
MAFRRLKLSPLCSGGTFYKSRFAVPGIHKTNLCQGRKVFCFACMLLGWDETRWSHDVAVAVVAVAGPPHPPSGTNCSRKSPSEIMSNDVKHLLKLN